MDNGSEPEKMGRVLHFPTRKDRSIYRYSLILTVASVFLFATFMNQVQLAITPLASNQYYAGEKMRVQDRSVASFDQNENQDILNEQKLAQTIKGDLKTSLSVSPFDQFIYGALMGKFKVTLQKNSNHLIESLSLNELGDVESSGLEIKNKMLFLNRYKDFFDENVSYVNSVESNNRFETFELLDPNHRPVGKIKLSLDEQGRVISFKRTN